MENNMQKMRNVLEYMLKIDASSDAAMEDGLTDAERIMEYADHIAECQKKARAALAAPLRNCDIFKSEDEMKSAFIAYYNEASGLKGSMYEISACDLKHDVDGILHDYIEWLFSPAKSETKGEDNGSK